jgi:hypothetical protein
MKKDHRRAIRDRASRDAQKLDRARGYSDLAPELVWEQWQVVREKGS